MPSGVSDPKPASQQDAFPAAAAYVVDVLEGGAKLITDTGGETRYGISARAHPGVDIASLTRDKALAIYWDSYWRPIRAEKLPAPLALLVFDAAVNVGPAQAVMLLQRILGVADDGVMGPLTLDAVRESHLGELLARYCEIRLRWYQDLADHKPLHRPSLYGWRLRVLRVAIEAGRWSRA